MRRITLALFFGLLSSLANADLKVGMAAPKFAAKASDGRDYRLADFQGKFVVLQWYNKDCPFIRKHYDKGNMQKLQETYGKRGIIWFEIISSAPGKQGYLTAAQAQAERAKSKIKSHATLLDPDGAVGRLYGAKTTPHCFIVDPKGILIYEGAVDDHNSVDPGDIPKSKNYVAAALDEALAGKPVAISSTKPYGCSVKYEK